MRASDYARRVVHALGRALEWIWRRPHDHLQLLDPL